MDREILGFEPILAPAPGTIQTAALMCCAGCGNVISGMGGPRAAALCLSCVRKVLAAPEPYIVHSKGGE